MHIQPAGGRHFDVSLFYQVCSFTYQLTVCEILDCYQDLLFTSDDDGPVPDASAKFEELLTRVRAREHTQRALQRIPFSLAPGLEIGVGM